MANDAPLVLISRPRAASERFADALRKVRSVDILIAPVVDIVPVGDVVATESFHSVIFTSAQAVARAHGALDQTAYCVGARTAKAAQTAGYDAISAEGTADDLVALIRRARPAGPLLHVRGEEGSGDVAKRLTESGFRVAEAIAYRQADREIPAATRSRIAAATRIIAPVFSPRSAARLGRQLDPQRGLTIVAISTGTAEAWGGEAAEIVLAAEPTAHAMLQAVVAAVDSDSQCCA